MSDIEDKIDTYAQVLSMLNNIIMNHVETPKYDDLYCILSDTYSNIRRELKDMIDENASRKE